MAAERGFFLRQGWDWLWSMGLAIPLVVGAALVLLVLITVVSPHYQAPQVTDGGSVEDYEIGDPRYFEEEKFWLVRLNETEFVALYERDPRSGCTIGWGHGYEFMGVEGWFRDACTGNTYDLAGACFQGTCDYGLNRLDLKIENGEITIDPRTGNHGPLRSENEDPINPPQ